MRKFVNGLITFAIVCSILLCGCLFIAFCATVVTDTFREGVRGARLDGTATDGFFDRCTFDGHTYITYTVGVGNCTHGGLTHDPDCQCQR